MASEENKFQTASRERRAFVERVVRSTSKKRIVVAGPGTGKTFLFSELLKGTKNSLTLTFINSLVDDLSLSLCGLSEVKTLHAFARGMISKSGKSARIFPKLSAVISEDLRLLKGDEVDFDQIFYEFDQKNPLLDFYKTRKDYYNYYGLTDIVFGAVKLFEKHPRKIPSYDLVLVDEFQDFNLLEVTLIDQLATTSPIVLAGDDDQALYFFKKASPQFIRDRFGEKYPEYDPFTLEHCSRCTRVIVEACNDIIKAAIAGGYLKGRIEKKYRYFEDEKRETECNQYSKIVHATGYASKISYFVKNRILELAKDQRREFSVLIIAPTKSHGRRIFKKLTSDRFSNVKFSDHSSNVEIEFPDGLGLLVEDAKCNLGWRILSRFLYEEDEFVAMLKKSSEGPLGSFVDLIDKETRVRTNKLVRAVKQVTRGKDVTEENLEKLIEALNIDPTHLAEKEIAGMFEDRVGTRAEASIRNIPITISTIPGSKGLAADFVFIWHFDDRLWLDADGNLSDQSVCNVLVALTRARRKAFLYSCDKKEPTFLKWISRDRLEKVAV